MSNEYYSVFPYYVFYISIFSPLPGPVSRQPVTHLELIRLRLLLAVTSQLANSVARRQHRHAEQLCLLGGYLRERVY